ncbi:hypothetical protein A9988_09820 [Acinetobacter calcoaceticus]|nr:hypothetical protein A9988_09820 [Acinetobacter calcoaceticus]
MSELVQILLSKQLTVNLGRDDQGEAKTVVLQAGLQQVEKEIAEHWFVAAHSQEIPAHSAYTNELEQVLEQKDQEIAAMQIQIDEAAKQILKHDEEMKAKDKELSDLKIQSAKELQDRDAEIAKLKADLAKATPAKEKATPKET